MPSDERPEPKPAKANPAKGFNTSMLEAGPYLSLGIQVAISMVFFVLLGYFADQWLGTEPWLLLLGIVLSLVATAVTLYRAVGEMDRASAAEKARKGKRAEQEGRPERPAGPRW
jgi:F0F1-type ATP synthase assembly protein I